MCTNGIVAAVGIKPQSLLSICCTLQHLELIGLQVQVSDPALELAKSNVLESGVKNVRVVDARVLAPTCMLRDVCALTLLTCILQPQP